MLNTEKKTVIIDKDRKYLIQRIFKEYSTGTYSLRELRDKTIEWGLRTRKGKRISTQTLHGMIKNTFYYGEMKVKGIIYFHKYERIISKELFDQCQDVRTKKSSRQSVKVTKHPFILRGLITCATSHRKVTCDLKKKKYVYLICRKPEDLEKKMFIKEAIILEQIYSVFKSLKITKKRITKIHKYIEEQHSIKNEFYIQNMTRLNAENKKLTARMDRLVDMQLDESITKNI